MRIRNIIVFLIVIFAFTVVAHAGEINTGFTLDMVSSENQKNYNDIDVLTSEPKKNSIYCFDVNEENGLVALCYDGPSDTIISIYDSNGIFKYGYKFYSHGSVGIEWDGNNILVYYVRGNFVVSYDQSGKVQSVGEVQDTKENREYADYIRDSREREANGFKYVIKNNAKSFYLLSSYSQLVCTDENGVETIIYDASNNVFWTMVIVVHFVVALIICVLIMVRNKMKKSTGFLQGDRGRL